MEAALPHLSSTMRTLARYCLHHHASLHRLSITDVSQACATVPSTVVRFARRLGFDGFQSFKLAFVAVPAFAYADAPSQLRARSVLMDPALLVRLDETASALAGMRQMVQQPDFYLAAQWLRDAQALTLTFHTEFDRLVAMHLGDVLGAAGKQVALLDHPVGQRKARTQALQVEVHVSEARRAPGLAFALARDTLNLEVPGQRSSYRIQNALCLADLLGLALTRH